MKPRTKLQKTVVALSAKLPPLTESQERWIKRYAIPASEYRCKKDSWCTNCGSVLPNNVRRTYCPNCGTKFESVENKPHSHALTMMYYTTIHTTCKGFQVARHFLVKKKSRKNRPTSWEIWEVVQEWIDSQGEITIMARCVIMSYFYSDLWNFNTPLSIKIAHGYSANRYYIYSDANFYQRVLPILKRNGFEGDNCDITPSKLFSLLLSNPLAEILLKSKQIALLKHLAQGGKIEYLHAVKICNRNGYIVTDASIWCDYIRLLDHFGKDTHNAHYVCPRNLHVEHDRLVAKRMRQKQEQEHQERVREAATNEAGYLKTYGRFLGIVFQNDAIKCHVLQSVQEFVDEAEAMGHCVFDNEYFKKPNTVIVSACDIHGGRLETAEINTENLSIVQCRGKYNGLSPEHDEIINLIQSNIQKFAI